MDKPHNSCDSSPKTAKGSLEVCKTCDFSLLIYGSLYFSADKVSYGSAYFSDRPCRAWRFSMYKSGKVGFQDDMAFSDDDTISS
jgi:hypothetical protein